MRTNFIVTVAVVAFGTSIAAAAAETGPSTRTVSGARHDIRLNGNGVGPVTPGESERSALRRLQHYFGVPTDHPRSDCGGAYANVAWQNLIVQFKAGRFSGYRYVDSRGVPVAPSARVLRDVSPKLTTAHGAALGSTLAEVRRVSGTLRETGTARFRSIAGVTFAFWASSNANSHSRVYQMSSNFCPAAS